MRLEEYWGIGPKTRDLLADELGTERAIEAIETADVRALTDAGLARGRVTRILRHAHGGQAMDVLATRDARDVYKRLLETISEYAVTEATADRIRILTPLNDQDAMTDRLDDVLRARDSWANLDDEDREAVLAVFETYDSAAGDRAAVQAVLALRERGLTEGVFEPLAALDTDTLTVAAEALAGLSGTGDRISAGVDDQLDTLRDQLGTVEDMAATPAETLDAVQSGARASDQLREELTRHVATEAAVDVARVREALPSEATDARGFVTETLRALATDLRTAVEERESDLRSEFEDTLAATRDAIDTAVESIEGIALSISLARFALAFDLERPTFVDRQVIGVLDARNLFLLEAGEQVQPITYAVGTHDLPTSDDRAVPQDDRVTVLTGANSGGKTTLLETLCQVQLLAQMGLPVPADQAQLGVVDRIVFHRRHASFNAGVLESTLNSVVPPVTEADRTLMLVDEFEAITEPGSAADLLHGLVTLTVEQDAVGVFVTHLADDLEPLPDEARTDGIFAEGLTTDLELEVDYQPRFETVGRSTPEFIVSRLVANASDRRERAGYETLATAIGETAVQRTLADARWQE